MAVKNTCDCPNPPGGKVVCEPHQMAVCIISGEDSRHECLDPIDTNDETELVNWAITEITGTQRDQSDVVSNEEFVFLESGQLNLENGPRITFSLPLIVKDAIAILKKNKNRNREKLY